MPVLIDLSGRIFGRLVVAERTENVGGKPAWRCLCACGTECVVSANNLRNGSTSSCGCYRREHCATLFVRHGLAGTPEWLAWSHAKRRCSNPSHPSFARYGGRGIRMCDEWMEDFAAFLAHVGPRPSSEHSIDRIDNDGNYEPGNVRWATRREQQRNRRNTVTVLVDGRRRPLVAVAEETGVNAATLRARVKRARVAQET